MKFFTILLKALAAAGASAAIIGLEALRGVFSGAQPSDVSPFLWGLISMVGILIVNFLVGKIPKPAA